MILSVINEQCCNQRCEAIPLFPFTMSRVSKGLNILSKRATIRMSFGLRPFSQSTVASLQTATSRSQIIMCCSLTSSTSTSTSSGGRRAVVFSTRFLLRNDGVSGGRQVNIIRLDCLQPSEWPRPSLSTCPRQLGSELTVFTVILVTVTCPSASSSTVLHSIHILTYHQYGIVFTY